MNILVTGLCLSRNLGGPSMGLTLVDQLRKKYGDHVAFKFAITPFSYEEEAFWAKRYGLQIVRRDKAYIYWISRSPIGRFLIYGFKILKAIRSGRLVLSDVRRENKFDVHDVHKEFMDAFRWADLVIDMSGIIYVGDGVRGSFEGIGSYSNFYYAQKHKKPFARFIQSFGPFDDWKVKYFAKKEFSKLPFVPTRGEHSAEYCRAIVNDSSKIHAFPDSAILLPTDQTWADAFLWKNDLQRKEYVIVSPSSVIHRSVSKSVGGSVGGKHVDSVVKVCVGLIERGERIVFLPHMYSKNPLECDREVARLIANRLPKGSYVIVEDDIDPMMAKGLIASSKFAIVSRYHALVAALSTGVDVVTIGWNIKYQDIMEYYCKGKYAVDMRRYEPDALAQRVLELTNEFSDNTISFEQAQKDAEERVHIAFEMLFNWIDDVHRSSADKVY